MLLEISKVHHRFTDKPVLHDINLQVGRGQFVALVGPSGCGKSTLLRAILGTDPPTTGSVIADKKEITGPSRDVGIVYQQYSLYPFLTSKGNVALGPKLDKTTPVFRLFRPFSWRNLRRQQHEEATTLLSKVGLKKCLDSYPQQLSGGMRQRVAIAQAVIMQPKILLLDEPFGALDEATREDLQRMLLRLRRENMEARNASREPPYTVIVVTHELNEAFYLADRVIGLSPFWQKNGVSGAVVGSTVMYDKEAPYFGPDDPRDFNRFADLKLLLRKVVFDEKTIFDPDENITYWRTANRGNSHA